MNNEVCIHNGIAPVNLLINLHHSQAGSGRLKCPCCAFEQGFILGSTQKWSSYLAFCETEVGLEKCQVGSMAPEYILLNLGDNQGGFGRHKCTNCAFKQGFEVGVLMGEANNLTLELFKKPQLLKMNKARAFKPFKNVDFLKTEIENKHLGLLGELIVIQYEKEELIKKGRNDLLNSIEHSSLIHGDGLGYDILSFDSNGNKKYIEVKTTRGEISRPFYLTINELEFSKNNKELYHLYRIFDFDTKTNFAKMYQIKGNLNSELNLDSILFIASPN